MLEPRLPPLFSGALLEVLLLFSWTVKLLKKRGAGSAGESCCCWVTVTALAPQPYTAGPPRCGARGRRGDVGCSAGGSAVTEIMAEIMDFSFRGEVASKSSLLITREEDEAGSPAWDSDSSQLLPSSPSDSLRSLDLLPLRPWFPRLHLLPPLLPRVALASNAAKMESGVTSAPEVSDRGVGIACLAADWNLWGLSAVGEEREDAEEDGEVAMLEFPESRLEMDCHSVCVIKVVLVETGCG